MKRSLGFRWLPYDGEFVASKPGRFAIKTDTSVASGQFQSLVVTDLNFSTDEVLELIEALEELVAGKEGPEAVMAGIDGMVFFFEGVALVASGGKESSAVLLTPDNLLRVLRAVYDVFTSVEFRNPDAVFADVSYGIVAEGWPAWDECESFGGTYTKWVFDPKRCEMVYEGMPDGVKYPHPIPPHLLGLCE